MNEILHTVGPLIAMIIGLFSPKFVEWLKANPAVKFVTPETIVTIRAVVTVIAVLSGSILAYLSGNDFDVKAGLTAIVDALIVALAYHTTKK